VLTLPYPTYYFPLLCALYAICTKLFDIAATCALVYKTQNGVDGYDQARDVFPHIDGLVLPCAIVVTTVYLGLDMGDGEVDIASLLFNFSLLLESVAIVPQLILLQKYRDVQPKLANGILFMGMSRTLHFLNFIYCASTEKFYDTNQEKFYYSYTELFYHFRFRRMAYISGVVEVLLYAVFFYSYSMNKCRPVMEYDESERTVNMTYKPLLQKIICCCKHVEKEKDEDSKEKISGSEVARSPNALGGVQPSPHIFTPWTSIYAGCFALAFIAIGKPVLPFFIIPVYVLGIIHVAKWGIKFRLKRWQNGTLQPANDNKPSSEQPLLL
jgi:ER lumen protein retaining receptor